MVDRRSSARCRVNSLLPWALMYPRCSRAAALSPSLWVAPDRLARLVRGAEPRPDTVLYMDYGSREMGNHELMQSQFARVAGQLLSRGVKLTCRIVPEGEHCEASWERQTPFFIETLMYGL